MTEAELKAKIIEEMAEALTKTKAKYERQKQDAISRLTLLSIVYRNLNSQTVISESDNFTLGGQL